MNTDHRTIQNRANASHSTGPSTLEGKQRASMNALKHGLTGQRLILQPEEHDAYRALSLALQTELRPRTTMEQQLVQKIIDTHMRLNRIAAIDNNMLNIGLMEEFDEANPDSEAESALAQTRSWIARQISFEKLGRYEGRLSRQLLAYTKELERLQTARREQDETNLLQRLSRKMPRRLKPAMTQNAGSATLPQSVASFGSDPVTIYKPVLPDAA